MKKTLLFAFLLVLFSNLKAQAPVQAAATAVSAPAPDLLAFKETEYNFGKIPQGKPVYHLFEFTNKSNKALKLDNVQASCGCTTPEWSKDEVAAGGKSVIKVGFNAAAEGPFEKQVTVFYNGTQTQVIRFKGEVWKAPAGSAPANAPVSFLKQQIQ